MKDRVADELAIRALVARYAVLTDPFRRLLSAIM